MKSEINIDIRFEGIKFYPSILKEITRFPLEILAEYGKISKIGRYKGKPSPYGLALLKIERNKKTGDVFKSLNKSLDLLIENKTNFKRAGLKDIIIDIDAPAFMESEFSLEAELLTKITKLNARIDWHAIPDQRYDSPHPDFSSYVENKIMENYVGEKKEAGYKIKKERT